MPRKLPPHVERNHVKGHTYLSFRRGKGPRVRLPSDPTSDEFLAAYQAALLGQPIPTRTRLVKDAPGSLGALIASYLKSAEFIGLRDTSKAGYMSRLDAIRIKHGHRSVAGLSRERINTGILQPYADRPAASLDTLKKLRVLIRHAINIGWLKHDPSLGIKRAKINEVRSWTDAEIEVFAKRWPVGTKQRLAFALFLYTGQRRSDIHRMTWADITGDTIQVVQQKTGAKLVVPLHRDLAKILAASPRKHVTILNTEWGRPFTVDGFGGWMREAISKAGLPLDCQPHGLRKAAGRRLAEAGCTAREIMAVLGHKTLAQAELYTRDAEQAHLAERAVIKLEARKMNKAAQTAPASLGKIAKSKGKSK